MTDAYINGFCKAAEAYGVDPVALVKAAGRGGEALNFIRGLWSGGVNRAKRFGHLVAGGDRKQLAEALSNATRTADRNLESVHAVDQRLASQIAKATRADSAHQRLLDEGGRAAARREKARRLLESDQQAASQRHEQMHFFQSNALAKSTEAADMERASILRRIWNWMPGSKYRKLRASERKFNEAADRARGMYQSASAREGSIQSAIDAAEAEHARLVNAANAAGRNRERLWDEVGTLRRQSDAANRVYQNSLSQQTAAADRLAAEGRSVRNARIGLGAGVGLTGAGVGTYALTRDRRQTA